MSALRLVDGAGSGIAPSESMAAPSMLVFRISVWCLTFSWTLKSSGLLRALGCTLVVTGRRCKLLFDHLISAAIHPYLRIPFDEGAKGLRIFLLDSLWVSSIHVVPKKGGMTVVLNDNNELIPSRTVTQWRVNEYYCFLDGFSGFFHIPMAPEDLEKTTFTCPYGTFAYRRMPFGLCNAPATFQRCMTAIFHDMVEDFMEVFMGDFSVFGNSFDCCIANLDKMLARCEETNLVLNWEKCHFMVKEGIVLGHKISGAGIEVDRAKINVIAKLPYPTNVKDTKFDFSDDCKRAFNILKERLTTVPIIISPDWNVPFELMCDTSDFAVGAVLGQQIDGKFKPTYYANKTLNNAQEHYTTTKKELLAVVFSFDKFRSYLVLSKTVVYTNHSTLKYLFSKQDAKQRLIRWVILLQGFDIEIKDKKGAKNLAADQLSRLENLDLGTFTEDEIADEFPDEHLMILKAELNDDEPCKILEILVHCPSGPIGGHHSASITGRKVYESGFFWPSNFNDANEYVMRCDACQRSGNISSRSEMPQNNIQMKKKSSKLKKIRLIMEYLVKISKKACILELKLRHLKITVQTSYTPYPSRKIQRICACTSQNTTKDQGSIRRI
ncbi:reverse transcriptase domain-containing protein [Tanacetum coccineum]